MNVEWRFSLQVVKLPLTSVNAPRIPTAKKPLVSAWTSVLLETGPAIHGSTFGWLEGNFRLLSTIGAGRLVHLALEAALSAWAKTSICHFYFSSIFWIQTQKQLNCFLEGLFREPDVSSLTWAEALK